MRTFSLLLLCLLAMQGCGDSTEGDRDGGSDAVSADASVRDVPGDVPDDTPQDVQPDASVECTFPALQIGGTPATNAHAADPSRCGAPSYAWTEDEALATVTQHGMTGALGIDLLRSLISSQGVTLDPMPTHSVAFRQYAYMTQDRGALVEATALVAYPTDVEDDPPVLLFLHGTSGFTDGCGASEDVGYRLIASLFAAYGYLTVMPDYVGLGYLGTTTDDPHPYLVGEAGALSSLDAVRAATQLAPSARGNTCMQPRVAIYGVSQGGHLALWTERLAPYYVPELEVVGTVASVPPVALIPEAEHVFSTLVSGTGNLSVATIAMASWYGATDRLDEVFVAPWADRLSDAIVAGCDLTDAVALPETLDDLILEDIQTAAAEARLQPVAPWGCFLAENDLLRTSVPRLDAYPASYGILMITGENDTLVNTAIEREAYATLCDNGLPIEYLECEGADHGGTTFWSLPEGLRFLAARFAGEPFERSCAAPAASRCSATPEE